MAGVLVHPLAALHRQRRRERPREGGRIVDGELVEQRVAGHAPEAFRQAQGRTGADRGGHRRVEAGHLVGEVRRLDHQGVAVPVAARVAHPLADAGRQVAAAVERHDARVVHHLVQDHDVVGRLEDLQVLVVAGRDDRRTGVEPEQAALREPAVLVAVGADAGGAHADRTGARPVLAERQLDQLEPGLERRHAAVRRVDDERRPPVVDDAGALVDPVVVVAADVAADRQQFAGDLGGRVQLGAARRGPRFDLRRLLVGQHRAPLILRPLQRRQGAEVPHPLQVGPAVRQTGRLESRLGRRRRGRTRRQCDQHARDGETANQHVEPPCLPRLHDGLRIPRRRIAARAARHDRLIARSRASAASRNRPAVVSSLLHLGDGSARRARLSCGST